MASSTATSKAWIGASAAFARWRPVEKRTVDLVEWLLEVRSEHLHDDAMRWRLGDIRELLLGVFPRTVQSDPDLIAHGPEALRDYLRFLDDSGQLKGAPADRLFDELAAAAHVFAREMADRSRWGLAKTMSTLARDEGVDLDDHNALQGWLQRFNDLPYDERAGLIPALPPEPEHGRVVLPPVPAVAEDDLHPLAVGATLLRRIDAVLAYLGPAGRPVTPRGAPKLVDLRALAEPCEEAGRLAQLDAIGKALRATEDLPNVSEAWQVAIEAGLLHVTSRATRLPGPPDVLQRWVAVAGAALDLGCLEVGTPLHGRVLESVEGEIAALLLLLYTRGDEPVTVDDALAMLAEIGVEFEGFQADLAAEYVRVLFRRLARLNAVAVSGEPVESASLTPLGTWWLRTQVLPSLGVVAPAVGELAAVSAEELCDRLEGYPMEAAELEVSGWTASREPRVAVQELAGLLASTDPVHRGFAMAQLDGLPGAADEVRRQLEVPRARPFARLWLESAGHEVAAQHQHPEDAPLLYVELAGAVLATGGQIDGLDDLEESFVRDLWRVDCPFTRTVLEHLAESGPKPLRKSARKALFSLTSAGR